MSRSTRFPRRSALAIAIGAGLAVAVPAVASAHVGVSPEEIAADTATVLTFSFAHGCDGSPTTSIQVTMPDGLASVAPTVDGVWDIDAERGDDGLVTAVTYTALTPIPSDLRGTVTMQVRPAEGTEGDLVFPVVQTCESGATEWVEVAGDGKDPHDLDAPAPVVALTAAGEDAGSAHDEHGSSTETSETSETAAQGSDGAAPTAIALGAGGLAAGLAALVVSVIALRRRNA